MGYFGKKSGWIHAKLFVDEKAEPTGSDVETIIKLKSGKYAIKIPKAVFEKIVQMEYYPGKATEDMDVPEKRN